MVKTGELSAPFKSLNIKCIQMMLWLDEYCF